MSITLRIKKYFDEVIQETKKVRWPNRSATINYTIVVIAISLATAAFLGGLDSFFTFLLKKFVLKI